MTRPVTTLDDKYLQSGGRVFISSNQALVRLPLDQARRDRAAGLKTALATNQQPRRGAWMQQHLPYADYFLPSLPEAVEFAMRQELDSVLFYLELKAFVPSEQEEMIEAIVKEERRPYATLLKFKRDLGN